MSTNCDRCQGVCQALTEAEVKQLRTILQLLGTRSDLHALADLLDAEKTFRATPPHRFVGG